MQALSLEEAVHGWRTRKLARDVGITPEDLGRIMICALVLYWPDKGHIVSSGYIEDFFIDGLDEAPPEVRRVLHPEQQMGRMCLRESTELVLGPQATGMVGRLNPDYTDLHIKVLAVEALVSLAQYEKKFPQVVAWIIGRLRQESRSK